jgi:hypothetical protein
MPMVESVVFFKFTDQEKSGLDIIDDPEQRRRIANDLMNARYRAWEQDRSTDFYCCFCEYGWHVSIFDGLCRHFHLTNWSMLLAERSGLIKGDQLTSLHNELSTLLANLATEFPVLPSTVRMLDYVVSSEPGAYLEDVEHSIVFSPGMWDYDEMDGMTLMSTFLSFLKTLHHSISEAQQAQKYFLFEHPY